MPGSRIKSAPKNGLIWLMKLATRNHFIRNAALTGVSLFPYLETRLRVFSSSHGVFLDATREKYIDALFNDEEEIQFGEINPIDFDYFNIDLVGRLNSQYSINFNYKLVSSIRKEDCLDYQIGIDMGIDLAVLHISFALLRQIPANKDVERLAKKAKKEQSFDPVFRSIRHSKEYSMKGYIDLLDENIH